MNLLELSSQLANADKSKMLKRKLIRKKETGLPPRSAKFKVFSQTKQQASQDMLVHKEPWLPP